MSVDLFPDQERHRLRNLLASQNPPFFCQVATIDDQQQPQVRTVHVLHLEDLNQLFLSSHTGLPKWQQLTASPNLAACHYNYPARVQVQFSAQVNLLNAADAEQAGDPLLQAAWAFVDRDVKARYYLKRHGQEPSADDLLAEADSYFGVVVLKPMVWRISDIDANNWITRRVFYERRDQSWHASESDLLL